MVMGHITEVSARPAVPAAPLYPNECIVVIGQTTYVPAVTVPPLPPVPAVGTMTLVTNQSEADVFGVFADGTLPRALKAMYDEVTNMNVVAIRASTRVGALDAAIDNAVTAIVLAAPAALTIAVDDVFHG